MKKKNQIRAVFVTIDQRFGRTMASRSRYWQQLFGQTVDIDVDSADIAPHASRVEDGLRFDMVVRSGTCENRQVAGRSWMVQLSNEQLARLENVARAKARIRAVAPARVSASPAL